MLKILYPNGTIEYRSPSYVSKNRIVYDNNSDQILKNTTKANNKSIEIKNFSNVSVYYPYPLVNVKLINLKDVSVFLKSKIIGKLILRNSSIFTLVSHVYSYNMFSDKLSTVDIFINSFTLRLPLNKYLTINTILYKKGSSFRRNSSAIDFGIWLSKDLYYCSKTYRYISNKGVVLTYDQCKHMIDSFIKQFIIHNTSNLI